MAERLTITLVLPDDARAWEIESFEGPWWIERGDVEELLQDEWDGSMLPISDADILARRRYIAKMDEAVIITDDTWRLITKAKNMVECGAWTSSEALKTVSSGLAGCPLHIEDLQKELAREHKEAQKHLAEEPKDRLFVQQHETIFTLDRANGIDVRLCDLALQLGLAKTRPEAARLIAELGIVAGQMSSHDPWVFMPLGMLTGEQFEVRLGGFGQTRITVRLVGDMNPVTNAIRPYAGADARS